MLYRDKEEIIRTQLYTKDWQRPWSFELLLRLKEYFCESDIEGYFKLRLTVSLRTKSVVLTLEYDVKVTEQKLQ